MCIESSCGSCPQGKTKPPPDPPPSENRRAVLFAIGERLWYNINVTVNWNLAGRPRGQCRTCAGGNRYPNTRPVSFLRRKSDFDGSMIAWPPTKAFAKTCPLNNNFPLTSLIISGTILLIYPHSEQTGAFCPESGHIRDSGFPRDSRFHAAPGIFYFPTAYFKGGLP